MDFLVELALIIGEKIANLVARTPTTKQSEKAFQKNLYFLKNALVIFALGTSVLMPLYVIYSSYVIGNLKNEYFYIGIALVSTTLISNLFAFPKYLELIRQNINKNLLPESSTIEEEIKYEIGLEILLAILSGIPVLNLILFPLVPDRALNILEMTANNSKRKKTKELAESIAFGAMLIFLVASVIVSFAIIILGDTRNLN